jgi:LPXTG-motif cell wall-anchored protein
VTKTYALPCYEEAIDALPTDIRDYTNAEDVITRALSSAVRSDGPTGAAAKPVATSGQGAEPVLFAVAGLAVVVLAAGGTGYVLRRRRSDQGLVP